MRVSLLLSHPCPIFIYPVSLGETPAQHLACAGPYETLSCSVTGLAGVVVLFIQYCLDCTFTLG